MKIVGIIPARYKSSRFEGKPLADICGKPMIWWVYNQVKQVTEFDEVYVATDDERISTKCKEMGIEYVMTLNNHPNHISRLHEVSEIIDSDYYVCINGDEPMLKPEIIRKILPQTNFSKSDYIVRGLMRDLVDPAETVDFTNLKIVVNKNGESIYMSRTPVPYPRGTLLFRYKKYVGVEGFNKKALDFFVNTPIGEVEKIEDIDHLRFIENGIRIKYKLVESDSLSVDTPKDLAKVRIIIKESIGNGVADNG